MNDAATANAPAAGFVRRLTRQRLMNLCAAALGAALGLGTIRETVACRKKSARCSRKEQCCSERCKRGFCYPRRR